MIVMRVQKLVESKCDQLAFKLCRQAIHAIRLCTNAHPLRHTVSVRQHQTLLETYLSLLFKFKRLEDINTELDSMDAESAAEYIENSFISIDKTEAVIARKKAIGSNGNVASMADHNNHLYVNRLHKYHVRVSQYALQYFLVKTLRTEHSEENLAMIRRLLRLWMDQHRNEANFHDLFYKLVLNSKTKFQFYFCCETLYRTVSLLFAVMKRLRNPQLISIISFVLLQYPEELDLLLQVFCVALTKDINSLETKKYDDSVNATDLLAMEKEVSKRYLFLAEVLSGHPDLERECILTAFSMNPTAEFFELVCTLAERRLQVKQDQSQDQASEADGGGTAANGNNENGEEPTEADIGPKTEFIDALHVITGGTQILESKDYDAEVAPSRLIDELTMLSKTVRHDLTCMLSVTRIKNLTWLTPWNKLKEECAQLLENEEKRRIVEKTTAAANAKLQYLKLNYDEFKDFKPHEYPGIEKGYEMYVPISSSDESIQRSDRDSDETDTAPESKMYKKREAKRLSDKKRRQVKRSKKILEQLDDDHEMPEGRARIVDGEKKMKAIQNMLNLAAPDAPRPRRPRPKTTRPRKKKVKVERAEGNTAEGTDAVAAVKTEEIEPKTTAVEQPLQPLEQQVMETLKNEVKSEPQPPSNEEDVRQLMVNQNVLQAVSDILGDTPTLLPTNGIKLLEEIIGTKPGVNDICPNDLLLPGTRVLVNDASVDATGECPEKKVDLTNAERVEESEQKDVAPPVSIEQAMRKRLGSSEDDIGCAKRRLPESTVITHTDIAQTHEQMMQNHPQQIPFLGLDQTKDHLVGTQNGHNLPTDPTNDGFLLLDSLPANDIKIELIPNASIDRVGNDVARQLNYEAAKLSTHLDEIVSPQLPNPILLPQMDASCISSQLVHLPLLPVATPPSTKSDRLRNPLLAFRKQRKLTSSPAPGSFFSSINSSMASPYASSSFMHLSAALRNLDGIDGEDHNSIMKCNSPIDQLLLSSSGTDTLPISRRDSISAISFSSSGDHTSDSMLTAASNGPEILTKHCTIRLERIENNEALLQYLQRENVRSHSIESHQNNESVAGPAAASTPTPMPVPAPVDNHSTNCRQNFLGNSMQPVVVLKQLDADQFVSNKSKLMRDKRTINGCSNKGTTMAVALDVTEVDFETYHTISKRNTHFRNVPPINGSAPALNEQEGEDNDDEDDDDDGRKSVEIDGYGATNNHNDHDDDDDDFDTIRAGYIQFDPVLYDSSQFYAVHDSYTVRDGDGGSGGNAGNGQQQTQRQRCPQQGTSQSQQSERNGLRTAVDFSWNYVGAPITKMQHSKEVSGLSNSLNRNHFLFGSDLPISRLRWWVFTAEKGNSC